MALPNLGLALKITGVSQTRSALNQIRKLVQDLQKGFQNLAGDIDKSSDRIVTNFNELSRSSKVFDDLFQKLDPAHFVDFSTEVNRAFSDLGRNARVNVAEFDRLVASGMDVDTAMQAAAGKIDLNAKALTNLSLAAGAAIATISILAKVVKDSVSDYVAYNEQIRRFRMQLGVTGQEASVLIKAFELSGVSATRAERGLSIFAKKLADAQLDIAAGKEVSENLARALRILGLTSEVALLPMADALDLVNRRLLEMEPGWLRNRVLVDLFGMTGREMAVVLGDADRSLAEMTKSLEDTGISLVDTTGETLELIKAKADLKLATQEAKSVLAREWIPILIDVNKWLAKAVRSIATLDVRMRAMGSTIDKFHAKYQQSILSSTEATEFYNDEVARLSGQLTEAEKAQEDFNQALAREQEATALAAEAERARLELMKEELEAQQKLLDKLEELRLSYGEKLIDIQTRFDRRWEDLGHRRAQDDIERALRTASRINEIWIKLGEQREAASVKFGDKLADISRGESRKLDDFRKKSHRQRENIEQRHRDKLWSIEMDYLDSLEEAVRSNDAVAVLRAQRRRRRAIRDAEHGKGVESRELDEKLSDEREQISTDADRRREDAEINYRRELRRLEVQAANRRRALNRQLALESAIRETHNRFVEENLRLSQRRQEEDAKTHFIRERQIILDQLGMTAAEAEGRLRNFGMAVAKTTADSIKLINQYAVAAIEAAGGGRLYTGTQDTGGYRGRRGSAIPRAEGGVDIVKQPTTFLAGEAGPEIAAFIPLRGRVDVRHEFSRLNMDINGAGGMNTNQAQDMVWVALQSIARDLVQGAR